MVLPFVVRLPAWQHPRFLPKVHFVWSSSWRDQILSLRALANALDSHGPSLMASRKLGRGCVHRCREIRSKGRPRQIELLEIRRTSGFGLYDIDLDAGGRPTSAWRRYRRLLFHASSIPASSSLL
jgi:hypothetical protein